MDRKKAKRKVSLSKRTGIWLAVAAALTAAVYIGTAFYFQSHFLPSVTLNGISISGKSQDEVERLITEEINGYEISIKERNGNEERIKGADISLRPEFGDSILTKIEAQNGFAWPVALFRPQTWQEPTMVRFDEEKLEAAFEALSCVQPENQTKPKDARCSKYQADGYQILPEEQGNKIRKKQFFSVLKEAVGSLKETVDLEKEDCYAKPKVTAEDEKLNDLLETLNQYVKTVITYDLGEETKTLDGSTIHAWLDVSGTEVSINEEAVAEYVDGLASAHNTVFRKHTFQTSYGKTIDITNGDYGWKVDKEGEKEQILKDIREGGEKKREITYAQRGKSHGANDYGDTYVEINLTAQHLYFYKNGSLLVESDFVSGNLSKNYDTPTGIYGLTYKERDAVLRGENYASPVTYWMPFCNNVGMHDASWRGSFGGNIYKTSGSHGCINLPKSAAQKIFENIEKGDPVLVYTLPGTESPAAVAQEAAQVVNMINGIGEVTLESEPAIAAARKMYNLLSAEGQAKVSNYELLLAQEAQLAALKAMLAPPPVSPEQAAGMQ